MSVQINDSPRQNPAYRLVVFLFFYMLIFKPFNALTPVELYKLLQLREQVFEIEQQCIYPDIDDKDMAAHHLFYFEEATHHVLACCRILPPGVSFTEVSIGRVATSQLARGKGMGKMLLEEALKSIKKLYGPVSVRISAQLYLKSFYESFGFISYCSSCWI